MVKNLPANAGDIRYLGSVPGLGRFPWRREWLPTAVYFPGKSQEQAGRLQSMGSQRVRHDLATNTFPFNYSVSSV